MSKEQLQIKQLVEIISLLADTVDRIDGSMDNRYSIRDIRDKLKEIKIYE